MQDGIYENDRLIYLQHNMNCKDMFYASGILPSVCLKIYKTHVFRVIAETVPEEIRMGEDAAFTYPYILRSNKIVVDNTIHGYFYRQVVGSMTRVKDESLFTGSSMLYDYLKPIYYYKHDRELIVQLETYKIFLAEKALNLWIADTIWQIHERRKEIQNLVSEASIFKKSQVQIPYVLPKDLQVCLEAIYQSRWTFFEIQCVYIIVKRKICEIVGPIIRMIRKTIGRASSK